MCEYSETNCFLFSTVIRVYLPSIVLYLFTLPSTHGPSTLSSSTDVSVFIKPKWFLHLLVYFNYQWKQLDDKLSELKAMERTSSFSVALEPSLTPNMYQFILSLPSPLTPVVSHTGAAIDANWSETESTYMPIGTLKHIYLYQPSMLVTELCVH